ncbi:uncharacterized protein MICPUCDRAFT_56272 [Micromonas pusilla CCMP1545]|uniref:Predicted protein n=1 Tax=Micromonas pusilla (strain CCMP1545) TaxID=564608 RepID=C1MLU5_MICPC|nr:uncharacterized protein MICPUCDRAFT_56272 [Micromonas pusilla CCMP1545]EEH58470.1 predicted protein [Micromonas pusilla CCMP1545]|eukprot:XP_003056825.1 predicted protein [Micromonas pusilla CCMP1545]
MLAFALAGVPAARHGVPTRGICRRDGPRARARGALVRWRTRERVGELTRTSGGRGATSTTARRAKPKDDDWGKGKKEGKSQSQGKDQKKKDKDKDEDEEKPKDETSAAAPVATEDAAAAAEIIVPPGGVNQVRSIHWSPYDRVGVVNADP